MSGDNQPEESHLNVQSLIVKDVVEVELILHDGTALAGKVFIGRDQRVQDLLNDGNPFFRCSRKTAKFCSLPSRRWPCASRWTAPAEPLPGAVTGW